jgi:hypothetical protein
MPTGPSEGANLLIAFRNRMHTVHHDGDGKAELGEQDRGVVMLVVARHADDGEIGLWVVRSLAASPSSIPGPYRNSKPATIHMEQRMVSGESRGSLGIESRQNPRPGGSEHHNVFALSCGDADPKHVSHDDAWRTGSDVQANLSHGQGSRHCQKPADGGQSRRGVSLWQYARGVCRDIRRKREAGQHRSRAWYMRQVLLPTDEP